MEIGNLFITATKNQYRYPYIKGFITTEDLWSLPVAELDAIYKNLKSELKEFDTEESLLDDLDDAAVTITNNQIEIVKYIVKDKLEAADRRKKAADNAAKRQRIMELIADKEDSALRDKTADELREMLEDLK